MSLQKRVLAVIMGGGRGTRLHPLTAERCKPAVPLAGKYRLVLILSGGQLYRMDYRKIIEQHLETKADVTIAAVPFPVSKCVGLGLMQVTDDLAISRFVEKPKDPAVIDSLTLSKKLEAKLTTP